MISDEALTISHVYYFSTPSHHRKIIEPFLISHCKTFFLSSLQLPPMTVPNVDLKPKKKSSYPWFGTKGNAGSAGKLYEKASFHQLQCSNLVRFQ